MYSCTLFLTLLREKKNHQTESEASPALDSPVPGDARQTGLSCLFVTLSTLPGHSGLRGTCRCANPSGNAGIHHQGSNGRSRNGNPIRAWSWREARGWPGRLRLQTARRTHKKTGRHGAQCATGRWASRDLPSAFRDNTADHEPGDPEHICHNSECNYEGTLRSGTGRTIWYMVTMFTMTAGGPFNSVPCFPLPSLPRNCSTR